MRGATGLCERCYKRAWYAKNRDRERARLRERYARGERYTPHPRDVVVPTCHPDRKHMARGLCAECYQREWNETKGRERYGHKCKSEIYRDRATCHPERKHMAKGLCSQCYGRERGRAYFHAHRDKCTAIVHRRRARLRDACSPGVSAVEWHEILETFGHACAYCLRRDLKLTRDHVEPIARGGRDEYTNVVPACRSCNSKKNAGTLMRFVSVYGANL